MSSLRTYHFPFQRSLFTLLQRPFSSLLWRLRGFLHHVLVMGSVWHHSYLQALGQTRFWSPICFLQFSWKLTMPQVNWVLWLFALLQRLVLSQDLRRWDLHLVYSQFAVVRLVHRLAVSSLRLQLLMNRGNLLSCSFEQLDCQALLNWTLQIGLVFAFIYQTWTYLPKLVACLCPLSPGRD